MSRIAGRAMLARRRAVFALTLLLTSCGGTASVSTTGSDPTATSTTSVVATSTTQASTTPSATAPATASAWIQVTSESVLGGFGAQQMKAVAAGEVVMVAGGYDESGGERDAAVWTSPDGMTWTQVLDVDGALGGFDRQEIWGVIAGDLGFVAVGEDFSGGDWDAAVWTSPDGLTWDRVPHDEAIFGGSDAQWMTGAAAGGPGVVAFGVDASGGDIDAAVWTTSDGVTWERAPHDEAVFGGPGHQAIYGMAVFAGGLVAVGSDESEGTHAAVWTSPDGVTWARVALAEGTSDEAMWGVTSAGAALVAVGQRFAGGDFDAAVWTSPDGVTWTRVPGDSFGGPDDQAMRGVVAGELGLLAVGVDGSNGDPDAAVWTSPDGESWTRTTHDELVFGGPGVQLMYGAAVSGTGVVAVGYEPGVETDAAVWLSAFDR